MLNCGQDNFRGEKVFEYFPGEPSLRRKNLTRLVEEERKYY